MHVAWLHALEEPLGTTEQYLLQSARMCFEEGWRTSLIQLGGSAARDAPAAFSEVILDGTDPSLSLRQLSPDLCCLHGLPPNWPALLACGIPTVLHAEPGDLASASRPYGVPRRKSCQAGHCPPDLTPYPPGGTIIVPSLRDIPLALRNLAAIISHSRADREEIINLGFRADKVHYLPPVVEPPEGLQDVSRTPDLILYTCDSASEKDRLFVQEAASLAGTERAPLALNMQDLGARFQELRRAALFICMNQDPDHRQAHSLAALSQGTPLIVIRGGAGEEWLRHGETALLVPAADPNALARAMERVLRQPEFARRLATNGQALVEKLHSRAAHRASLLGILAEAAHSHLASD